MHLLIREEFMKVQKVSNNKYRIKELMLNNVVLVNRKPLKAKHIIGYASEVLPTITGAVVLSTTKGLMTHIEATRVNEGGRVLAVIY